MKAKILEAWVHIKQCEWLRKLSRLPSARESIQMHRSFTITSFNNPAFRIQTAFSEKIFRTSFEL